MSQIHSIRFDTLIDSCYTSVLGLFYLLLSFKGENHL